MIAAGKDGKVYLLHRGKVADSAVSYERRAASLGDPGDENIAADCATHFATGIDNQNLPGADGFISASMERLHALANFFCDVLPRRQCSKRHGAAGERGMGILRADAGHELPVKARALQVLNDGPDAHRFETLDHAVRT